MPRERERFAQRVSIVLKKEIITCLFFSKQLIEPEGITKTPPQKSIPGMLRGPLAYASDDSECEWEYLGGYYEEYNLMDYCLVSRWSNHHMCHAVILVQEKVDKGVAHVTMVRVFYVKDGENKAFWIRGNEWNMFAHVQNQALFASWKAWNEEREVLAMAKKQNPGKLRRARPRKKKSE